MRLGGLVRRNLLRNKRRSLLALSGIALAVVLLGFLQATLYGFNVGVEMAEETRLIVRNKNSLIFPLPYAYKQKLLGMEGIDRVAAANWFGAEYVEQDRLYFGQFAAELDDYLAAYSEFEMTPEDWAAIRADKRGCLLGDDLARVLGKEVGDTIALKGTIVPGTHTFNVRGIFTTTKTGSSTRLMLFRYDYFDELVGAKGITGFYVLRLHEGANGAAIARDVDALFANSAYETLTESEKEFNQGFVEMMGNISLLVTSIGAAVVFSMLLVVINSMMMSARERTREWGMLKAVGFSDRAVASALLAEALILAGLGWMIGASISLAANLSHLNPAGMFEVFMVPTGGFVVTATVALVTGLLAGGVPALQIARLRPVEALRSI